MSVTVDRLAGRAGHLWNQGWTDTPQLAGTTCDTTAPLRSDRWTICSSGHVHWGSLGGAGFLFRHVTEEGSAEYLLAKRSSTVDEPGKWGVPGGAIRQGESPESAARRETQEEIGVLPKYVLTGEEEQACGGGWAFQLLHAEVTEAFRALCGQQTDSTGWFEAAQMSSLPLHPGISRWLAGLGVK